jgi:hypothetical protein
MSKRLCQETAYSRQIPNLPEYGKYILKSKHGSTGLSYQASA